MNRFGRCIAAALLFAAIIPAGTRAATMPERPALTEQGHRLDLESFDYVWNTINEKHFDPEFGGLDWAGMRAEFRPRVERASSTAEARAVMDEMINRLDLSHYNIIPAEVYAAMDRPGVGSPRDGSVGIDARVIGGRAFVVSVLEGFPAADAGVQPGWEILRVGEDDARSSLEIIAREYDGFTWKEAILSEAVHSSLRGRVGETITIVFGDDEDHEIELRLPLVEARGHKTRLGYLPDMHVFIDVDRVGGDIGYIAFNMFLDPARLMPVFNDAMKSFLDAEGLIIDIRGNQGGLPGMAMGMIGWLVDEKGLSIGTLRTRDNELKLIVTPRPETYSGPVAVLVDGLSGSSSEFFAGGLKDIDRARIVGSRTAGAVLMSSIEKLPNGDGFQYTVGEFVSGAGALLEGHGVAPHIESAPSREALLLGRDPALESAITWIRSQE